MKPDLTILGKIVGGGLPLAAFGGRADAMQRLAPGGNVYQAGTLSGNPLATAAGLSVLRRLRDPAVYDELEARAAKLERGLRPFGEVQRVGAMLTLFRPGYDELFARARRARACTSRRRSTRRCSSRSRTATRRSTRPWRRCAMPWQTIAAEAAAGEPALGRRASPRARARGRLLAARGRAVRARARDDLRGVPRALRHIQALRPAGPDVALLLGDYLYAHGLVRIAELGDVEAIRELAELIARCAHLRAEGAPGDGEVWAETAERLDGGGAAASARAAALAAHARRVG